MKAAVHRPTFLKRKISVIFCFEYKLRKLIICIPQKHVKLKPLKLVNTIPRFERKFMHLSENSCSKLIIKIQAHFKKFSGWKITIWGQPEKYLSNTSRFVSVNINVSKLQNFNVEISWQILGKIRDLLLILKYSYFF